MKVVLIGYMASGKSSVGRLLAKELSVEFIDLDAYIEKEQQKSIDAIFSEKGEIFFRKLENEMLQKVLKEHESILLSTGGGTPCYANNIETILNNSDHSIYLQLSVSCLVERISSEKDQRPLVKDIKDDELPEFVGKHLFERRQYYEQAKHIVGNEKKTLEEVVAEIKGLLL